MSIVYHLNKGVSRPLVFKGLKAQYIGFLAGGLLLLQLLFAVLYILDLSLFIILPLIGVLGIWLFIGIQRLSKRFGTHGLMKYRAWRKLPKAISYTSRNPFTLLKHPLKQTHYDKH